MEDELGSGGGGGVSEPHLSDNSHGEALVGNMGSENQVDEPYEEGDGGEEIMVEIVGSDVFVDGVGGNEEGEFGPAEIGGLEKKVEDETTKISEDVVVSSKEGENKLEESELRLPESRDEVEAMDVSGGGVDSELDLPESRNENISVVTEAMDVSDEGGENERGESELGLPETRNGENYVVTEAMDVSRDGGEHEIRESEVELPETRDVKNNDVPESIEVSSEGVENKTGGSELRLPESSDEKNNVDKGENKVGESELSLPESSDEINNVDTRENKVAESELSLPQSTEEDNKAVTGENKTGGSELGLPELRNETNNVVAGENKTRESELGLPESKDETKNVAMGQNKAGESELSLPESRDETKNVVMGENKTGESELRLPKLKDENNIAVTAENKMGESELGLPESRDGENNVDTEAVDVSGNGGENEIGQSESCLLESRDEQNQAVTEEIDDSFSESVKVEVGISRVQTEEETIVSTQVVINEEKSIKDEVVDEKTGVAEKEEVEVLLLSDDAPNQVRLGSDSVTAKDSHDGLSENVQVDAMDRATVTTQTAISEEKMITDEALDEKKEKLLLSDDASNQDHSGSDSHDGEGPENDEGPRNVRADGIDSVVEEVDLVHSEDGDCDKEARFVDEKVKSAAESEGLVVNDSNYTKCEETDVVMDEASNINPSDSSCVCDDKSLKTDEDLEINTADQNHVVSDQLAEPAVEFDTDVANKDTSQEIVEIAEKNVSTELKKSLESQENAEIPNDVKICVLPENNEREISAMITDTSGHVVNELESVDLIPSDAAVSDDTEKMGLPRDSNNICLLEGGKIGEKNESEKNYHDEMEVDSELGNEEISSEADKSKLLEEERAKLESSLKLNQPGYFPPLETGARFAVSDLVWGKVRSHPWWPGQIFDHADASEKAVKYVKKDSYLVAYFGDRTFAWNESSLLKPFGSHFSQIEKQSNSEVFQNAVNSALEEVSRRVELGLACSCVPRDKYATIEAQIVENTGIREESSKRYGLDHSTRASSFEPDKLIKYVRDLAPCAFPGPDRLDLVIAQAQLTSFYRFKNYRPLIELPSPGELLEMDQEKITSDEMIIASHKRKLAPKHSSESRKERSLMELMGPIDGEHSLDAEDESLGKKRKALDPSVEGYDKRVSVYAAKLSNFTGPTPNKPSFKIGECIRRVASQLTGSASSGKDEMVTDGSQHPPERRGGMVLSIESFSVDEILSQLERVAQEPKKRHDFLNVIHAFFMGFRSTVALNRRGRKKRPEQATAGGPAEGFEFDDDVNDSYWTDRIVQNCSEEQLVLNNPENGLGNFRLVPFGAEKFGKQGRKPNSRKRFSDSLAVNELDEQVKRRKQESSPAELILNFAEKHNIPSEINLNKMFRRFGPLMESETEVDHELGCAKVIFKRGSDAEIARSSSEAFNVFGPVLVNYQIGYEPLISVRVLPIALPLPPEDATF